MFLIKLPDGSYRPLYPSDEQDSARIRIGDHISAFQAQNPEFHKKIMALLRMGWSNQERIKTFDQYRNLITVAAGFSVTGIGFDGEVRELPRSLSFKEMSAEESQLLYNSILEVISALLVTAPEKIRRELNEYL